VPRRGRERNASRSKGERMSIVVGGVGGQGQPVQLFCMIAKAAHYPSAIINLWATLARQPPAEEYSICWERKKRVELCYSQ
jgi:hypothetical protein